MRHVILDTDTGTDVDDLLALLFLAHSRELITGRLQPDQKPLSFGSLSVGLVRSPQCQSRNNELTKESKEAGQRERGSGTGA
jgi:hypothetical protein